MRLRWRPRFTLRCGMVAVAVVACVLAVASRLSVSWTAGWVYFETGPRSGVFAGNQAPGFPVLIVWGDHRRGEIVFCAGHHRSAGGYAASRHNINDSDRIVRSILVSWERDGSDVRLRRRW